MKRTWVLVADSCRARIFSADKSNGPISEIETLAHPEARLHERDITSDVPGHSFSSHGPGRHAMGADTGPKQNGAINFAKRVAGRLDLARHQGNFDQLMIVAAPTFLGMLRNELSQATANSLSLEMNKDLTRMSAEEIRQHLPEYLSSGHL